MPKTGSSASPPGRQTAPRVSRNAANAADAALSNAAEDPRRSVAPQGGASRQTMATIGEDFAYGDEDDDASPDPLYASNAEDIARYISDMVGSLAMMARESRLDLLTYLLDMARVEAEMQARQTELPFGD